MTIQQNLDALCIGGIKELDASNAPVLQEMVSAVLTETVRNIELDLSETVFLDSCGVGALLALRNKMGRRGGVLRVLNPTPPAQHIFELTRLHRVLEIVKCEEVPAALKRPEPEAGRRLRMAVC